ncbi:bifunctional DNA primase/polymerase [Streptomyces celluloflavus]|uniref:bifunctional DNA primase/polymerase n=1 Tax=Streptomyces celluloflavus TaxID=58344 RepID=UPI00369BD491
MTRTRERLLAAALGAAERGWYVHPLIPGRKAPALHGEDACPRTGACTTRHRKWEERATLDTDVIRAAWAKRPYNIGIASGPSGLVVVDLDMPKPEGDADTPDGVSAFQALCERAGQTVPTTHTVRTPSGGRHLYFTTPPGTHLPSTKGALAKKIDTRAWGGNIVATGSITASGAYEAAGDAPVLQLPDWLRDALTPAQRPARPLLLELPTQVSRYVETALRREEAAVRAAQKGDREATLFKAARAMGRFVAWGDLPRSAVEDAFHLVGESTGLPPARCRSTVRSALNWSIAHAQPRRTA